jgi:N-acetylglucosamine-6-phosphate deacetylase
MKYQGIHYRTGKAISITTEFGKITDITDIDKDESLPLIGPPLVDMQVNGYMGKDINDTESTCPEDLKVITDMFRELGITFWVPTIVTNSQESIIALLRNIQAACEEFPEVRGSIPGIHIEGPYISSEHGPRGAHSRKYVRKPSIEEYREWQEACGNMIRIVTLGADYDNSAEFIEEIVKEGVIAALGHCTGTREQLKKAVDAGATLATHLGNGAHPMVHRHNCYIWELLAEDRVWAGIIGDGFHLPQAQLQNFIRAKQPERVVLTSDVVYLGGMDPGLYEFGKLKVKMRDDGKIVLAENEELMAGASFHLLYSIENAVKLAGRTKEEAWAMASENPAEMMKLDNYPNLKKGDDAVFVLFTWDDDSLIIEELVDERTA